VKTIVVEEMKSSLAKEEFLQSNFTQAEIDYCRSQKNPESFFARWMAGKVAVMDAITAAFPVHQNPWSETPPPPLHEVEILSLDGENVTVTLKGSTLQEASKQGINAQQASLISENGLVTGIAKVQ
jgi:phosphopantetheinyl transferase (holo-ACP synthase)